MPAKGMETAALTEQLRDLQMKQKEQFKARVKMLRSKSPSPDPTAPAAVSIMCGDLDLMTATQEKVHARSQEAREMESLYHQLEQLQLEKAQLTSQLKESEAKLVGLQKTVSEGHRGGGGEREGEGRLLSSQKIVELSKKNRVLHAELMTERNRTRQMEKQLKEATEALAAQSHQTNEQERSMSSSRDCSIEEIGRGTLSKMASLQEELAQSKQKVAEYRNQCQLLKQDLKLAHKVLGKEVGPCVSVSALLNNPDGWRGRSQQILALQSKVCELKHQLEKALCATVASSSKPLTSQNGKEGEWRAVARQKAALEKIEKDRKQSLEGMRMELERAQAECLKAQQECRALRARNKTLAKDVKLLRAEQQTASKTTNTDNALKIVDSGVVHISVKQELEQTNELLRKQLAECKKALQHSLSGSMLLQHGQLEMLRQPVNTEVLSLPPIAQPPSQSFRRKKAFSVRKSVSAGQSAMNTTLREAQLLAQAAEVERDQLLELTAKMQQQLDATTDHLMSLKAEKHALLRHQRIVPNSGIKQGTKAGATASEQIEDLKAQLAIQMDEIVVLKDTLQLMRQEKKEDAKKFHAMLQDTKQLFVDIMREQQNDSYN